MANKMRNFISVILLTCISLSAFAQAENPAAETAEAAPSEINYYIDYSEAEPRFIQRLIWEQSNFVYRYEVIVERQQNNGSFTEVERLSTEESFAEVSLPAGNYRYQINLFDLLDEYASTTRWREFEIIRALQPELAGFSPSNFYLDEEKNWVITLRGQNLLQRSEIFLVDGNRMIRAQSHTSEGNTSIAVFSPVSLSVGKFYVYVRNPGGLDTRLGTFTIANKKPFDMNISVGYAPIIPLYGYLFKDSDIEAPFPDSFYLLGAGAKISIVPFKRVWGNLGLEVSSSFTKLKHDFGSYTPEANALNTHLSFLYQLYFFEKFLALNVSLGAGAFTLMDFHYKYPVGNPTENITSAIPSAAAGLSFMIFVFKPFFINLGADFIHAFSVDSPMPGFITPFLHVGFQL